MSKVWRASDGAETVGGGPSEGATSHEVFVQYLSSSTHPACWYTSVEAGPQRLMPTPCARTQHAPGGMKPLWTFCVAMLTVTNERKQSTFSRNCMLLFCSACRAVQCSPLDCLFSHLVTRSLHFCRNPALFGPWSPVRYVVSESVGDWISLRFGWFDSATSRMSGLSRLVLQEHLGQRLHPLNHRSPESYL